MKFLKFLIYAALILALAFFSIFLNYKLSSKKIRKRIFHPLDYLEADVSNEALRLRKAKDLLLYSKPQEAINELLKAKGNELSCWKDYFMSIARIQSGESSGWKELLNIGDNCASRIFALKYVARNCRDPGILREAIGKLPEGEISLIAKWRAGNRKAGEDLYCHYPETAQELGIVGKADKNCYRERFNIFSSMGKWNKALREALHLDRLSRAKSYFYLRKYRKVVRLLRRPTNREEVYLLFKSYIRLSQLNKAEKLKIKMERYGLSEDFLWQEAMFYYPQDKGFFLMGKYLKKYPHGKYSEEISRYITLRGMCISGERYDEGKEGVSTLFNLSDPSDFELKHMRKAALLKSVFLYKEAIGEIEFLRRKNDSPLLLYLEGALKEASGDLLSGLKMVRKAFGGKEVSDGRTLSLFYPLPLRDRIWKLAKRNGIDPFLLAALIHQESLFNPEAISSAGAVGLMQIMRRTFKSTVKRMGGEFSNPYDPEENLKVGIRHFSELLNYYGSVPLALAAYNAGREKVDRWLGYLKCKDPMVFIELIPIKQTRSYVKMIMHKWKIYRRIYEESGPDFRR